jgi:hypothetical protein
MTQLGWMTRLDIPKLSIGNPEAMLGDPDHMQDDPPDDPSDHLIAFL